MADTDSVGSSGKVGGNKSQIMGGFGAPGKQESTPPVTAGAPIPKVGKTDGGDITDGAAPKGSPGSGFARPGNTAQGIGS